MCGIAGIIHNDQQRPLDSLQLEKMTDVIQHRGPDGFGYWNFQNIGLGHRRLSIIDLEGSVQPMSVDFENFVITYNGEIYNYLELKKELQSLGHQFKTQGDTEVLLKAYVEWGKNCLHKLRGMFAFAVVDKTKEEVFLARDHFGIKPLLFYKGDKNFAFGSEIQQFKHLEDFDASLNTSSLKDYFGLGYIPAPKTIYKRLHKLAPGNYLRVSFGGHIIEQEEYYDLNFNIDSKKSYRDWKEELEIAIDDSVKHHKIADVPLGTFLSGGIDSSIIASSLSKYGKDVKAFTMGFFNEKFDETPYAKQVAEMYDLKHHIEKIDMKDMLDVFPQLIKHYGEPFADSSAVPTYYISKRVREYLPVVLSGDGGDEAFGGYWSYQNFLKIAKPNAPKDIHKTIAKNILKNLGIRYATTPRSPGVEDWFSLVSMDPQFNFDKLFAEDFFQSENRVPDVFKKWYMKAQQKQLNLFQTVNYLDYKTYIHSDILTKVDVASMMNSLEVRTPLIDKEIISIATQIPNHFKIKQNRDGSWSKKRILSAIAEKRFGKEFTQRKKRGFVAPIEDWFKNKELKNDFANIINNKSSSVYNFLDYKATNYYFTENNRSSSMKYQIYFLEKWMNS